MLRNMVRPFLSSGIRDLYRRRFADAVMRVTNLLICRRKSLSPRWPANARHSLSAPRAGLQEIASGGVSPFDQRGELELANLTFLHGLWAPGNDQPVHFFLHRLALASPILKCVVRHRTLPFTSQA